MSTRITLAELRSVVDRLVDTDDFTALANRSVKRLYAKAATPGDTELYHFGAASPTFDDHTAAGGVDLPPHFVLLPEVYSHALRFKIYKDDDHDFLKLMSASNLDIVPLESIFQNAGYDPEAFIDYGEYDALGGRIYAIPEDYSCKFDAEQLDNTNVYALVRRAYVDVIEDTDTFPFSTIGAMKMAILATLYEDENDMERADLYWASSIKELESESLEYRGPQQIYITYYDPASEEVTTTIN
jgi:hypothetical protein